MTTQDINTVNKGKLVRFSNKSDVYKVIEQGYKTVMRNMYTDKVVSFSRWTANNNIRQVEVVSHY